MTTHCERRCISGGLALAACLCLAALPARAQNPGADPGDKGAGRGVSTTTGLNYAGGDSYMRSAPPRWSDALYDDVLPNKPDPIEAWQPNSKKPRVLQRVGAAQPASFRLTAPGETVLRLTLSALGHTEKLADPTLAVAATIDGVASVMTFKAKKFKPVIVAGDSTCWISEPQELYVPLPEGAHVIELTDARRDTTVTLAGTFAIPSGQMPR